MMRDGPKVSWSSLQAKVEKIRRGTGKGESSEEAPVAGGSESGESAMAPPADQTSSGSQNKTPGQRIGDVEPDVPRPLGDPVPVQGPVRLESVHIAVRPRWRYYLSRLGLGFLKSLGKSLWIGIVALTTIGLTHAPVTIQGNWVLVLFFLDVLLTSFAEASFSRPEASWWRPGRLETTPDGVEMVVDGVPLRLSRAEILSGWTTANNDRVVVLQTKRRTVAVGLPDRGTTTALMRELGVAVDKRVFSVPLSRSPRPSRFDPWTVWPVVVGLLILAWQARGLFDASLLAAAVVTVHLVPTLVRLSRGPRLLTTRVHVGVDGFTILEPGKREFVSFAEIAHVYSDEAKRAGAKLGGVKLTGENIHVQLPDQREFVLQGPNADATKALHAHLQAGLNASAAQAPSAVDLRALERRGRGVREWLGSVKTAAAKAGDYRHDWLDGRDLPALVTDARMDAEQRIAAAAALSTRSDPEVHGRLRIALHASANVPVRVAIEKALDGELEAAEIEHALEAERVVFKR